MAKHELTQIRGIGPKLAAALDAAGIKTLAQLAALTEGNAAQIDAQIRPKGRPPYPWASWSEQARGLTERDAREKAAARMERAHEPLDSQTAKVNVGRPSPRSTPPEQPPGGFPTLAERNRRALEAKQPAAQSMSDLARAHAAAISTDLHAPGQMPTLAERVAREGVKRQLHRPPADEPAQEDENKNE